MASFKAFVNIINHNPDDPVDDDEDEYDDDDDDDPASFSLFLNGLRLIFLDFHVFVRLKCLFLSVVVNTHIHTHTQEYTHLLIQSLTRQKHTKHTNSIIVCHRLRRSLVPICLSMENAENLLAGCIF